MDDMEDALKAFEVWQKAMDLRNTAGVSTAVGFDFVTVPLLDFIAHVRQELSKAT